MFNWLPIGAYCQNLTICPFVHLSMWKNKPWLTISIVFHQVIHGTWRRCCHDHLFSSDRLCASHTTSANHHLIRISNHISHRSSCQLLSVPHGSSPTTCAARSFLLHADIGCLCRLLSPTPPAACFLTNNTLLITAYRLVVCRPGPFSVHCTPGGVSSMLL